MGPKVESHCTYCGRYGHLEKYCFKKKEDMKTRDVVRFAMENGYEGEVPSIDYQEENESGNSENEIAFMGFEYNCGSGLGLDSGLNIPDSEGNDFAGFASNW